MNSVEQWYEWNKRHEAEIAASNNIYIQQFRKSKTENDRFWQNLDIDKKAPTKQALGIFETFLVIFLIIFIVVFAYYIKYRCERNSRYQGRSSRYRSSRNQRNPAQFDESCRIALDTNSLHQTTVAASTSDQQIQGHDQPMPTNVDDEPPSYDECVAGTLSSSRPAASPSSNIDNS